MKKMLATLTLAFAAATGMMGCVQAPPSTEAEVATTGNHATVEASTQIGSNYLYEVKPANSKNVSCFISASVYTGSAVSGTIDCVPKTRATLQKKNAATIESKTQIGSNDLYEVTPATRPDLTCFISTSIYTGSAVSGTVKCLPKASL